MVVFVCKKKRAGEVRLSVVGGEMCIREGFEWSVGRSAKSQTFRASWGGMEGGQVRSCPGVKTPKQCPLQQLSSVAGARKSPTQAQKH